jgi:hypothetical protein
VTDPAVPPPQEVSVLATVVLTYNDELIRVLS